jgi:GT2 family glycosyltransferase
LAELLPTLAQQTLAPCSVVVVDGGSEDGSREETERLGYRFLDLGRNRGFAAAVNAGMRVVGGDSIAVLNNDLRLAADWVERLAGHRAPFAVGMLRKMDSPEEIDGTWDLVSRSGVSCRLGAGKRVDDPAWGRRTAIKMAPWTAILLRRDYWETVGELDERFESYYEDVDYGLRGLRKGFRGIYDPTAEAWHKGSATFGEWDERQVQLSSRNQLLLLAKNGGRERVERDLWKIAVGQGLWGLAAARRGLLGAWLRGKLEGWRELQAQESDWSGEEGKIYDELEAEIFSRQAESGMDRFWRYYWLLS